MRILCFGIFLISFSTINGQSLDEILKQAEANYPLLKATKFEILAAESNVASAKNAAVPNLDAAYQVNYATYNNITGMASPQFLVPISGPPSPDNVYDGVTGSSASLLLNWDVLTFGQRTAKIDLAKSEVRLTEAENTNAIFRHQIKVIGTYLDLLFAHQLLNVYQKNLDRAKQNARVVRVLAGSGLRPGVDSALFQAEVSRSKIELLNYRQYLDTEKLALAELLGVESITYDQDSSFFHKLPVVSGDTLLSHHPEIILSQAKVSIIKEQRRAVFRTLYPKLSLWGTGYARGSGIGYQGVENSENGLNLTRYNYGVGLQLSIPLLRFIDVKTQMRQQDNLISAQQEKLNSDRLRLSTQNHVARMNLNTALELANESPVFYSSVQYAYDALLSRYNAGLANYADLIQSQYGLLKAESDLKKAYLEAWKSLLYMAAVQGDIDLFLNQFDSN